MPSAWDVAQTTAHERAQQWHAEVQAAQAEQQQCKAAILLQKAIRGWLARLRLRPVRLEASLPSKVPL
eukprot:7064958-Prorocentrum_lima.AAC.1